MAAILSELRDIKELSPEYQKIIKTVHVNYQPAVDFLVTIYNLVTSYGDNTKGILGHGHCQPVTNDMKKPQFKKILYKVEVIEFFVGSY